MEPGEIKKKKRQKVPNFFSAFYDVFIDLKELKHPVKTGTYLFNSPNFFELSFPTKTCLKKNIVIVLVAFF